ncbi:hypothetical protein CT0861_11650, partial [Colletotrichum tofieldiae]
ISTPNANHEAQNTCGQRGSCIDGGCAGRRDGDGVWRCKGNYAGCPCYYTSSWGVVDTDAGYKGDRLILTSNDNECQNLPAQFNDKISSIAIYSWIRRCQFHMNANCQGDYLYGNSETYGNWGLQGENARFNDQISSYKCWLDPLTYCGDRPCN